MCLCVCVGKWCVCVSELCGSKFCESNLCVGKLCVSKLCVCVERLNRRKTSTLFLLWQCSPQGSGAGLQSSTYQSSLQCPEDITGDVQ